MTRIGGCWSFVPGEVGEPLLTRTVAGVYIFGKMEGKPPSDLGKVGE